MCSRGRREPRLSPTEARDRHQKGTSGQIALLVHRLRQLVAQELGCGWEPWSIDDFAEMLSVLHGTT